MATGVDSRGRKICFACCADDDRFYAVRDGRWTGYLTCRPDASTGAPLAVHYHRPQRGRIGVHAMTYAYDRDMATRAS
jgi:hypothetical protein